METLKTTRLVKKKSKHLKEVDKENVWLYDGDDATMDVDDHGTRRKKKAKNNQDKSSSMKRKKTEGKTSKRDAKIHKQPNKRKKCNTTTNNNKKDKTKSDNIHDTEERKRKRLRRTCPTTEDSSAEATAAALACGLAAANNLGSFAVLPQELLHLVFTFLSGKEVSAMRCTCKEFNRLSHDQTIWKAISLREFAPLPNQLFADPFSKTWEWIWRSKAVRYSHHLPPFQFPQTFFIKKVEIYLGRRPESNRGLLHPKQEFYHLTTAPLYHPTLLDNYLITSLIMATKV